MEDMIKKYDELYDEMASSKDPRRMMAFGDAEKWMFHMLAERHPEVAEKWLTKLEAGKWNNYLSKAEAEEIVSKLINQDGSHGPHWDYDTFKAAVISLGGKPMDEPYYNYCALWTTANTIWSDHHRSISRIVPKEQEPGIFYEMAVEQLKDPDRHEFIREYFDV